MAVRTSDLHAVPLFQGITEAHLQAFFDAFEKLALPAREVLFEAGSEPKFFHILAEGEVALMEEGHAKFLLKPVAPIGELGALTGLSRNTTAVTTEPSTVYRIGKEALMDFFERHGDVAFPFHHNLLQVVARKIGRDNRRIEEMRTNLIRTQKAMKRILEQVLEAEETPVSKAVAETLEDLIEHNRRVHYLVEPTGALQSQVRLDNATMAPVLEISDGWLRFAGGPLDKGSHWSGVLVTRDAEIPLSGTVDAGPPGTVLVQLDLLIAEYQQALTAYLTRVQMLDFVV